MQERARELLGEMFRWFDLKRWGVLIERVKDRALAMYDRGIAMRVADRERALHAIAWDTPSGARALARRYDLNFVVIAHAADWPELSSATGFTLNVQWTFELSASSAVG